MFVGIDVAKDRLDVHVRPSSEAFTVAHDGEGIEDLVGRLSKMAPALVVLEATGGFETIVAAGLGAAGLPVVLTSFGYSDVPADTLGADAMIDHFDALVPTLRRVAPALFA